MGTTKTIPNQLPNFLVVGAQKAGSTAFYDLLKSHPEISLSDQKEIHFFDIDKNFNKGIAWYKEFFSDVKENRKMRGEVTPDYIIYNYVPERILETMGAKIKLIFLLRNPIERAYSQFNFHQMKGVENRRDFYSVIEKEKLDTINSDYNTWYDPAYYLSRGLYYNQIKRYLDYFDLEQMHFIFYEELFNESKKEACLSDLFNFLEVSDSKPAKSKKSNATKIPVKGLKGEILFKLKQSKRVLKNLKRVIPSSQYQQIRALLLRRMEGKPEKLSKEKIVSLNKKYFAEDIKHLEALIGKDCSHWLTKL